MKSKFMDETSSALRDIERSVQIIRKCNDAIVASRLCCALRDLKEGIRLIKYCDRAVYDHRGKRSSGKQPSVWEMQELIGLDHSRDSYDKARYKGERAPDGSYVLIDRMRPGTAANVISEAEMNRRYNEWLELEGKKYAGAPTTAGGTIGAKAGGARRNPYLPQVPSNYNPAQPGFAPTTLYQEDPNKAIGVMSKVNKAVQLVAQAVGVIGAIGLMSGGKKAIKRSGDTIAEIGKQLGRFKNFMVEKASQLKKSIFGR